MESSTAQSHDTFAAQKLVDLMRIPTENRSAAASELLRLIRRSEALGQYGPSWDDKRRTGRVAKRIHNLLKQLDGRPPVSEFLHPRCEVISNFATIWCIPKLPAFRDYRLFALITALYKVQKLQGGKWLTLTKNIESREASGSLPAALKIFHGFIPSIVKSRIPYSTLYRMRSASFDRLGIRPRRQR
jgi:hypothetical protein